MLDAGGGTGGISGDPGAIREAAGMLETNASLGEDVSGEIRSAASTVLAGWSAPSSQSFAVLTYQISSAASELVEVGGTAAGPLRAYADALEAAQRDFAQAKDDAESARGEAASAESGSKAEREADADLDRSEGAMSSAREAALAANERAAMAISTLGCTVPAIPAGPTPPPPPPPPPEEEDKPWWSDAGHFVLDGVGLVPGFGEPADGINALWYLAEGDKLNAGLSGAGMLPFAGWGATGTKWGIKGAKAADGAGEAVRLAPTQSFGNPAKLEDHFLRHGADFGASSADDYANQASNFLQSSLRDSLPAKIDAEGVIRVYDPSTNTFAAFNPDGTTRTFFKPSSPTYFDRQPGSPPQP